MQSNQYALSAYSTALKFLAEFGVAWSLSMEFARHADGAFVDSTGSIFELRDVPADQAFSCPGTISTDVYPQVPFVALHNLWSKVCLEIYFSLVLSYCSFILECLINTVSLRMRRARQVRPAGRHWRWAPVLNPDPRSGRRPVRRLCDLPLALSSWRDASRPLVQLALQLARPISVLRIWLYFKFYSYWTLQYFANILYMYCTCTLYKCVCNSVFVPFWFVPISL